MEGGYTKRCNFSNLYRRNNRTGAFLAGIQGPLKGFVNPEMGLFYAYIVSLIVLVLVSRIETELVLKPSYKIL